MADVLLHSAPQPLTAANTYVIEAPAQSRLVVDVAGDFTGGGSAKLSYLAADGTWKPVKDSGAEVGGSEAWVGSVEVPARGKIAVVVEGVVAGLYIAVDGDSPGWAPILPEVA